MFKLWKTRIRNMRFAVHSFDTPAALKQWLSNLNDSVDPKQGYIHTKFERPPLSSVHQKANIKVFVKSENTSICAKI